MRLNGSVKVRLDKLTALRGRTKPNSEPMMKWKKRSARKYRTFLYERFDRFSRGGGNWRHTKRRKSGKSKFILRKTHTMFRALSPVFRNLPGQYERFDGIYIETGFGGSAKHPEGNGITVANLARIHNNGEGIVTARQIVVSPSSGLIRDMRADLDRTVKRG